MSETEDTPEQKKTRPRRNRRPPRHYHRKPKKSVETAPPAGEQQAGSQPASTAETAATPSPASEAVAVTATAETPAADAADNKPKGIKSAISRLFNAFGTREEEMTAEPLSPAIDAKQAPETDAAATEKPAAAQTAPAAVQGPASDQKPKEPSRKRPPRKRPAKRQAGKEKPAEKAQETPAAKTAATPALKLLINTEEPEECRIALLENGKLEAFHIETITREKTKGNIYKGKIISVEPSLHAAFVDIGLEKNAFLPFNEIHPEYYAKEVDPDIHWKDLNIKELISKGQEVLVEVVKEAAGTKGANVTTYLSLPGRYLVLMPGSDSQGISRKLGDEDRSALKEMIQSFNLPEGIGYIIRTASKDVTKTALSKDVRYLLKLWETIKARGQKQAVPSLVFREQNIVARYLRDHFTHDLSEITVDSQEALEQVQNFLSLIPARQKKTTVRLHKGSRPLFSHYNVEEQIEQIYRPKVGLPSGGSIVINPTEALVAIDVNSGRTSKDKNFEESIFLANMEAAEDCGN